MQKSKNEILNIDHKIYSIRGKEVMIDSDLADLFDVETKRINEAVKRNPDKFIKDYYIRINEEEYALLKSHFATSKGGSRKGHGVFTEQGVIMLATILKSETAVKMSVIIVEAFVKMRHYLIDNKDIYKSLNNINNTLIEHDEKLDYLFNKFDKKEYLYLENSEYDAYSDIIKILKLAKKNIVIVDSYVDISFLDTIRNINKNIILITQKRTRLTKTEIDKYNKQYNNLKVHYSSSFHDRYIVVDNNKIYHLGASINYAGNKITTITKIEDKDIKSMIKEKISKIIKKTSQ